MTDSDSDTSIPRPKLPSFADTVIRIAVVTKLEDGRIHVHSSFRSPRSWMGGPNVFSYRAAFADTGMSEKSGERLYHLSNAHPYEIDCERELNGAAQCMLVDREKSHWHRRLIFFVTKDVECLDVCTHLGGA